MKAKLSRKERNDVARLIFEALCAQYPDRYIAFAEQEGPDLPGPERDLVKQVLQPSA
jgi:hypothetical protein